MFMIKNLPEAGPVEHVVGRASMDILMFAFRALYSIQIRLLFDLVVHFSSNYVTDQNGDESGTH